MPAVEVLSELRSGGYTATVQGDRLRLRGPCRPPADLEQRIADCRNELVRVLRKEEAKIHNTGEVLELARNVLPPLKEEDRLDLDEVIQANSPPEPGRDPLAKHETDKAHFFHAPAGCACDVCAPSPQYARRKDGKTYIGGDAA
jgi:hypothetical protein